MLTCKILTLAATLFIYFHGVDCLRDVKLEVNPPVVIKGESAAFHCLRDMQGAPLYSVSWYRGNHEFYRFKPKELPKKQHFSVLGIYVDMNNSNDSVVVLKRLDLKIAGNFSCEVSADDVPRFSTKRVTTMVHVIAPPVTGPVLKTNKLRYQVNDILLANCSIAPGTPPANLTIYVNDEPLNSYETQVEQKNDSSFSTVAKVRLFVRPNHFVGGERLRVSCVAVIFQAYRSVATMDFFSQATSPHTLQSDPRPERITSSSSSSQSRCWLLTLLLFFLTQLIVG